MNSEIYQLEIGKGADIINKKLAVSTTVTITDPSDKNSSIITYILEGGHTLLEETNSADGDASDTVRYQDTIIFAWDTANVPNLI